MDKERDGSLRRRGMEFRSKLTQAVGALIFSKSTKRYLFLLRNNGSWPMTWALPGGKIDNGETILDALTREIDEELGGTIRDPILIQLDKFISNNSKFSYTTYFISVEDEFIPFLNSEHLGYAWLPLLNAPNPLHPGINRTMKNPGVMDRIKKAESN
jgi:8-oxo-dGTP pyrophosphatase MutT (NUDIX family)